MFSDTDFSYMQRALVLAERGMFITTPNPRVGCVLVRDGVILGEGSTQPAGGDHAEVQALKDARSRGHSTAGATAYVTLEPCSHFGRTPPCSRALVEAGITRVIAAMEDPNPQVSGRGLEQLRDAGIDVRCGLLEKPARELNIGFVSRMTRGRPWVRLKVAASLDGFTALSTGESQWITGAAARADGHFWRARACAILTGVGTARADDPQLTVRSVETPRQPWRIVVDSQFTLPLNARLLQGEPILVVGADGLRTRTPYGQPGTDASNQTSANVADESSVSHAHTGEPHVSRTEDASLDVGSLMTMTSDESVDFAARAEALRSHGAEVVMLPNAEHKVDLPALMTLLGQRGINELHIEAGAKLSGSLIREGCVDEFLIYLAPSLLSAGYGMFDLAPPETLALRHHLAFHAVDRIGDDLRILARWAE